VFGSADGSVIVSNDFDNGGNTYKIWRWVDDASGGTATNIVDVPGLSGATATAMSADGNVIVGYSTVNLVDQHAFKWTNGGFTDLNTLGGRNSGADDVTADGRIAVGWATDSSQVQQAVRWTDALGVQTISGLLAKGGVDISGWNLTEARLISDDGNVIAGIGTDGNNVGGTWITHCASTCAIISADVVGQSFSGLGGLTATTASYLGSQFDAAGQMADAGKHNGVTGFAHGAFDSDPTSSADVGATDNLGNNFVIGGSLGVAGVVTNLPYSGAASFSGPSATLFFASQPDTGLNWLVGGSLVGLSGTVTRGYLNGNTPATSSGSTSGGGSAFTARAGWTFKDLVADTLVTPFVSATVSSVSYAGYSETGGPFPATFSAFSTSSAALTFGAEGRYSFAKDSALTARVAYAHTFGAGSTIAGSIPGILALSVPGDAASADVIEASVGVELPVKNRIRASFRLGATVPFAGNPSLQASSGLSMSF
jgi:probable HAF family extracellular repeat protein